MYDYYLAVLQLYKCSGSYFLARRRTGTVDLLDDILQMSLSLHLVGHQQQQQQQMPAPSFILLARLPPSRRPHPTNRLVPSFVRPKC